MLGRTREVIERDVGDLKEVCHEFKKGFSDPSIAPKHVSRIAMKIINWNTKKMGSLYRR